jgi:tetratricopeptide (TPR) repeat protein
MKLFSACLLAMTCVLPFSLRAAPLDDAIAELQRDWEVIRYQTPESARLKRFEALSTKAHGVSQAFAGHGEPLVWEGIIVSSLANEKGGLGGLSLAKQAKTMYEQAIALHGDAAMESSAYGSLAVLYYKVPGWPLGFGDKTKAEELLKKALSLNPTGIDPNYFYGEYLYETGRGAEAATYLERALVAPTRPGREVADTGRREEVRQLLAKVKAM